MEPLSCLCIVQSTPYLVSFGQEPVGESQAFTVALETCHYQGCCKIRDVLHFIIILPPPLQYFSNAIAPSPTPSPIDAYSHLLVCFSVIQPQTTNNRTHHSCHHQCQANSPSVHFFSLSTDIYTVLINNLLPLRVKFRPLGSHKCKQTFLRLP